MKLFRTLFVASSALVLSAASLSAQQAAAQVTCKDGSLSKAGRGACSSHGGVAVATKTAKADVKATDAKIAKTATKAEAKIDKTASAADAKIEKTEAKATTKVAKHSKKKAKAKA